MTSALDSLGVFKGRYTDIRADRSVVIHPLYVELMMASRWNVLRSDKFDIDADHTYDPVTKPLGAKGFYQAYVSKSLPCVFRDEIKDEVAVQELRAQKSLAAIDRYVAAKFAFGHSMDYRKT